MTAVLLLNPKTPWNIAATLRACSIYDARRLRWTGNRITEAEAKYAGSLSKSKTGKGRLPREERMKDYSDVSWREEQDALGKFLAEGLTPVAVEWAREAESLADFDHPDEAVYIFGPEDGSIPKGVLTVCHRFVRIPTATRTPLNLAAAVNVVLYDRFAKSGVPEWAFAPTLEGVR